MLSNESCRWCIYIDLLGFSHRWEEFWQDDSYRALCPLNELMRAIYRIGKKVYPNAGERLFVHQMGDGFAIVNDFSSEPSLERPIVIAIALMRCVATTNTFAKASIAEGDFGDITGCYLEEVMDDRDRSDPGVVRLGEGLMTLSRVMGTTFIRAHKSHEDSPSGPLLIVAKCHEARIPESIPMQTIMDCRGKPWLSIDWIRADIPNLAHIQEQACLPRPEPYELVQAIRNYCKQYPDIRAKWKKSLCALGIRPVT